MTEEQRAELEKLENLAMAAVAVAKDDEEDWYMAEHFPRFGPEDAAFIAAASPTVFLELLATIARLEAEKVKDGEALEEAEHALTQFTAFELDCREIMGNTNFAIVQHNHTQVRARLSSRAKDQSQ